jgi:hypothetical protein
MFGHILSANFAHVGLRFIMNHIKQAEIAEKLIG